MTEDFNILTHHEEQQLSLAELKKYYKSLREYLLNSKHENITKGSLSVCPIINPVIKRLLETFCGYKIITTFPESAWNCLFQ